MKENYKTMGFLNYQRGAALIVALVFMLILTIIGAASMQSATLQERMAGNARNVDQAFQAAEAALREAESELAQVSVGPFNGSGGLYLSCADPADSRTSCKEPAWDNHSSTGWKVLTANSGVSKQPEFIVEELSSVADPDVALDSDKPIATMGYYRVTARGYGSSDRGMVVLSTTYKRDGL